MGNSSGKPLSQTEDGKGEEDEAFDEDGGEGNAIRDRAGAMITNYVRPRLAVAQSSKSQDVFDSAPLTNGVSKVSIQA